MFEEFRQKAKDFLKEKKMTYRQLSDETGLAESTIKCFMSGATDSRKVAECIANALGKKILFHSGCFYLVDQQKGRVINEHNYDI